MAILDVFQDCATLIKDKITGFISFEDFFAGSVGGAMAILIGQPMDTVKARMQATGEANIGSVFRKLMLTDGPVGLYRGFGFPLVTTGFNNAIFFGFYGSAMQYLEHGKTKEEMISSWYFDSSVASMFAGTWQVVAACPVEVVKIRQQTASTPVSAMFVIKDVYQHHGIRGLFHGLSAMLMRDVPASALYIGTYDIVVDFLSPGLGENAPIFSILVAGGAAGLASWLPVIPFDVVKTKIQAEPHKYKGLVDCGRAIIHEEGFMGIWRGTSIVAFRAFPVNAGIFLGYTQAKCFCQWMWPKPDEPKKISHKWMSW